MTGSSGTVGESMGTCFDILIDGLFVGASSVNPPLKKGDSPIILLLMGRTWPLASEAGLFSKSLLVASVASEVRLLSVLSVTLLETRLTVSSSPGAPVATVIHVRESLDIPQSWPWQILLLFGVTLVTDDIDSLPPWPTPARVRSKGDATFCCWCCIFEIRLLVLETTGAGFSTVALASVWTGLTGSPAPTFWETAEKLSRGFIEKLLSFRPRIEVASIASLEASLFLRAGSGDQIRPVLRV